MVKAKENRLVVADAGWADTIPAWLKKEVEVERLTLGLAGNIAELRGEPIREVGDAEACLYLYTLSLRAPMGHDLTQAYFYLTAKLMKRRNPDVELPDFSEEKLKAGLTYDEQRELTDLKRELYRARGGEISHPLLDAMRQLGKDIQRRKPKKPEKLICSKCNHEVKDEYDVRIVNSKQRLGLEPDCYHCLQVHPEKHPEVN